MENNLTGKVSSRIDGPATRVWDALTNPKMVKQYFFGTDVKSDFKPGSKIDFTGEWQGKKYHDKGQIMDAQPFKLLRYKYWSLLSGREDKPENYANVTYELNEDKDGTILTISQDNIPDEPTKKHSEENWQTVLGNLKELLEHSSN